MVTSKWKAYPRTNVTDVGLVAGVGPFVLQQLRASRKGFRAKWAFVRAEVGVAPHVYSETTVSIKQFAAVVAEKVLPIGFEAVSGRQLVLGVRLQVFDETGGFPIRFGAECARAAQVSGRVAGQTVVDVPVAVVAPVRPHLPVHLRHVRRQILAVGAHE